jgi:hypothetical protein
MQIHHERQSEYAAPRWRLHRPAINFSLLRIRRLAKRAHDFEYGLVKGISKEIQVELLAIQERISECG